jgi:hypothetical protein
MSDSKPYDVLTAALTAMAAGISVHPCLEDGTKAPCPLYQDDNDDDEGKPKWTWLHPKDEPPGIATIKSWYGPRGSRKGFGVRCGSESGGLECLEFDAWDAYVRFTEAAGECGLAELVERIESGYCEESPSGGIHWLYFTDEIRGNTKLAKCPAPTQKNPHAAKTLIETRSENGFIVCAPSNGTVHLSGKPYVLKRGGFTSVVTISTEERDALWDLARSFDSMPKPTAEAKTRGRPPSDGLRPGDDFENRASWNDILGEAGWRAVYTRGSVTYWRRPDKAIGISATTNYSDSGLLYVFTSSTVFDSEKSYTKFGAYARLKHGGNFTEAARALRRSGFGSARAASAESVMGGRQKATGTDGGFRAEPTGPGPAEDDGPSEDVVDLWPTIDDAAFYGIAGDIVRMADPHTEADPIAVLIQFLIGFASAMGRGPFWVEGATRHYMVMFAAMVGPTSSARKGSSWNVVRWIVKHLDEKWAGSRIVSGLSSGEGLIYHIRDQVTKLDDDDNEVIVDPGEPDKRLLCIEPELARTLKTMNGSTNTLSAVLRQVWDCDEKLSTLTKNSTNVASFPHVSLIGHITCEELNQLLTTTDSANGLGNRFLWTCVRRSKELPGGGSFFAADWDPIIARLRTAFEEARGFGQMTRDPKAKSMWEEVYHELTTGRAGLLGKMLARAEPQVMRIACIYAMLDGSSVVREEHLEAALAVWDYAEASARFIFGDSLGDPKAERLLNTLRETPKGLTRTQISRDVFCGNMKKDQLAKLLQHLLNLGLIHRTTRDEGKPGPLAEVWFSGRAFRDRR